MKVDRQLIWLAIFSIIVLILGTFGFYQTAPESGFATALYQSIQLFSMESGVLDDPPTPLVLEVARWLALFTLLAAVFASVQAIFTHFHSTIRIAFTKNHAIVCGAGHRGDVIARAFSKTESGKVVVIEIDENNASLGALRNLGVEIIIGNALDATVLQKAGISWAKSLVAVTGSDEKNLSICAEVETNQLNSSCELSAGIESWAWRSYYLDRLKSKIRLDSFLSRATQRLMLDIACKAIKDPMLRKHGARLLIEGSGATLQELIRAAILMLQISGEEKPTIIATSTSPAEAEVFNNRFPAAPLVADIHWHTESACQVFPEGSGESPDFAIFANASDIETLEAAERFWMRHNTADDRVIACLHGESDSTHMEVLHKKERDFTVINLLSLGLGSKHPLEPDIEHRAKTCHAVYFQNEKSKNANYGNGPTDLPENWHLLPERLRESNRLAAMHHEVKRTAWHAKGDSCTADILTHFARCEHMRWRAEKAMDGWRWSGSKSKESRDNDKLRHHLLIPFDALNSDEKKKDYNAFLWALDISQEELDKIPLDEDAKPMTASCIISSCPMMP
jgi:hypothetical protein